MRQTFVVTPLLGAARRCCRAAISNAGRYIDALEVSVGDVVSPLWTGVILVAANPRRVLAP